MPTRPARTLPGAGATGAWVGAIAIVILIANYLGLFWQTSAAVLAIGSLMILASVIWWIIDLVRRRS